METTVKTISDKAVQALIDSLQPNETAITHVKKINGGKFSFQIVERMEADLNPLALLNASDDRFQQSRVRPAWINGTAEDSIKQFGLNVTVKDLEALTVATGTPDSGLVEGVNKINLAIKNPKIAGMQLRVQIEEQVGEPQYDNQSPKRAGAEGDFLTHNGELIYSTTRVVVNTPNHVKVPHNGRIGAMPSQKFRAESVQAAKVSFFGADEPEE